jgi:pimeloyl-ACP methyl ester carboxylesterase
MFTQLRKVILVGLLAVIIAGCAGNSTTPTPIQSLIKPQNGGKAGAGQYKQIDCPFTIPTDATDAKGDCGMLTVPEDRSKPDGKTIDLPAAVYPSSGTNKDAQPLLFLFSNPGAVLEYSWQFHYALTTLHNQFTFVFLEQRGVGLSKPTLNCPDVDAIFLSSLDKDPNSRELTDQITNLQSACRARLVNDGIKLASYSSAASAADLDDLRQALGYSQWNIYSIGYGTALAAELMRSYPTTVKSVVFEAMMPTDYTLFINQASAADAAINLLFKRCSEDKLCGAAYPDLATTFNEVVDTLNSHPISVTTNDLNSGKTYTFWVNGDRIISLVLLAVNAGYDEMLTETPRMLYQVKANKDEQLKLFLGNYVSNTQTGAVGMNQRIYCNEFAGATSVQKVMDANAKASPRIREYFNRQVQGQVDACAVWMADNQGKPVNPPVLKSDIPSLIISGDYGWSTSVDWSTQAAKGLSRSTLVVIANAGQVPNFGGQWADCVNSLIGTFFTDPGKKLDTTCATVAKPTKWITLP